MKRAWPPAKKPSTAGVVARRVLAAIGIAFAGFVWLVATRQVVIPYRVDPFATLDLNREADWLAGWRLARLKRDPALCRSALAQAGIDHRAVPNRAAGENCGLADAVDLGPSAARLSSRTPMECGLAATWILFEREVLAPAARRHFGQPFARATHLGSYSCRRIAGSATRWSEHARAKAIDISDFVLADGRRVSLTRDWSGKGPEAAFLREVRNGACGYFSTVLGPDYNAAHYDHFHFDTGPYSVCR